MLASGKIEPQMDGVGLPGHFMQEHIRCGGGYCCLFRIAFVGRLMRSGFGEDHTVNHHTGILWSDLDSNHIPIQTVAEG